MVCPCTIYFWSCYTFFQPYLFALLIWEITAFIYCFVFATFVAAFRYFQWVILIMFFMSFCMGNVRKVGNSWRGWNMIWTSNSFSSCSSCKRKIYDWKLSNQKWPYAHIYTIHKHIPILNFANLNKVSREQVATFRRKENYYLTYQISLLSVEDLLVLSHEMLETLCNVILHLNKNFWIRS